MGVRSVGLGVILRVAFRVAIENREMIFIWTDSVAREHSRSGVVVRIVGRWGGGISRIVLHRGRGGRGLR